MESTYGYATRRELGVKCVFIDEKLKETNPELYNQLLEFAKRNKLKVGSSEPLDD